jgi:hypothetical protein
MENHALNPDRISAVVTIFKQSFESFGESQHHLSLPVVVHTAEPPVYRQDANS